MLGGKILFTQFERGYAQGQADDINRELEKFFTRVGAEERPNGPA
jgi:phage-related protein